MEHPLLHPPEKYTDVITQEEWDTFFEWQTSEEGMALRARNSKNKKQARHPHLTGRAGYIGIEDVVVRVHLSFTRILYIVNDIYSLTNQFGVLVDCRVQ